MCWIAYLEACIIDNNNDNDNDNDIDDDSHVIIIVVLFNVVGIKCIC